MQGVRVFKPRAEELRRELARINLVDKGHSILENNDHVTIPVLGAVDQALLENFKAVLVDAHFPPRMSRKEPFEVILEGARVPDHLKPLFPDKWELLGDVLVIRLVDELDEWKSEIAREYASVLGAKTVLRDIGGVDGIHRKPVVELLLGEDTVTTHVENGILYRFDVAEIMFASGNMEERIRMSELACDNETIVDMFAGIGYFSIPIAVYQRPKKVIACEVNPVAHRYLLENARLNKVEHVVEPVLGDNREYPGKDFADRVIMGYVKTTHEFLPTAVRLLRSGGIVHYHETCPNELLPDRPLERLNAHAMPARVEVLRMKELKSYAPGVSHVVVDARIVKPA